MVDVKFVIVNGEIIEEKPDSFNGAFNSTSKRKYIQKMPYSSIKKVIKELKSLSKEVEAVQIEFDRYRNGYNVELEIYLFSTQHSIPAAHLDSFDSPCSVALSEKTYLKFINQLKKAQF